MSEGKPEEWSHAGHSLRIESWYPRSEMAITPAWYKGFVNGVLKAEGTDLEGVKTKIEEIAEETSTIEGEFGQEEF